MSTPHAQRLIVVGDTVSPAQAEQIVLRTNAWWGFSARHREWAGSVAYTVGLDLLESGQPTEETLADLLTRFRVLRLKHLYNARIACAFLNGPRGWCDWNGRIETSSYDTVNYPDPDLITSDWKAIAEAFPFLRLDAQILAGEGPSAQWHIEDGAACRVAPGPLLAEPVDAPDRVEWPPSAQGFTVRQLEGAVARLDTLLHGRPLAQEILNQPTVTVR